MVSLKKKVNDLEIIPFLTDIPDDSLRIKEYMFSNFSIEHKSDEKVIQIGKYYEEIFNHSKIKPNIING